ncbi:MAG TPA: TolC family protein [Gemmatimonadales bacterium]
MDIDRRSLVLLAAAILAACYPPLSGAQGAAPSAPSSAQAWHPPASAVDEARESVPPSDSLPASVVGRRQQLTPDDLVSIALQQSPETRTTWLAARAAAASLGEARSTLFPEITGTAGINRIKTAATGGRVSAQQTTYGPSLSVNWLLLDFGGRNATIDAARQEMFAANWNHNALVADVVRRTLQGYFAYMGARALLDAQRASLNDAQINLDAANERRTVGVATIADVLQARTAFAQAQLAVQQADGAAGSARGALATLIGLPPTASFDVDTAEATAPIAEVSDTVDELIRRGLLDRPDLAAERATVDARRADARAAHSAIYPSLSTTITGGTLWVNGGSQTFPSYNVGLALTIPIFNGFGWQYAAEAASLTADAETARLHTLEQQVALQVFQTWQQLRTASQSVTTSDTLYADANQSVDAARARYREGVGTLLELLTAESALVNARAQRIQSRVDWHTALVQLAHDAGRLQPSGATTLHLTTSPSAPGNH